MPAPRPAGRPEDPAEATALPGAPPLLVDRMLGRLGRYLRMLGVDAADAPAGDDAEVRAFAQRNERVILTRDRQLAARSPGAVWLASPFVGEQLRAVRRRFPTMPKAPTFRRCTECNGSLAPEQDGAFPPDPAPAPRRGPDGPARFACRLCGHRYWEGSHTARVRRDLERWWNEQDP